MSDFPKLTTVQRDALIEVVAGRVLFTCMTNAQSIKYSIGGLGGPRIKDVTIKTLDKKGLIIREEILDRMYGRDKVIRPTPLGSRMAEYFGWTS